MKIKRRVEEKLLAFWATKLGQIQMATINTDGISISEPFSLQTDWLAEHVRQGVVGGGW